MKGVYFEKPPQACYHISAMRQMILKSPYFFIAASFCAGVLLTVLIQKSVSAQWGSSATDDSSGNSLHREKTDIYKFINPLLWCGIDEDKEFGQYWSLRKKIETLFAKRIADRDITNGSLYFRELNNGRWFGINENDKFSPASLMKVARAIAYYKVAGKQPDILTKKVVYTGAFDDNKNEDFKGSKTLIPEKSYTVEELVQYMIQYSDNNATRLLDKNMDATALQDVYVDLDIPTPDFHKDNGDFLSAKSYSYFFRVLYNATYLRKSFSEKILGFLNGSDFSGALRAGVPGEVPVAHKFGERSVFLQNGSLQSRELHDCGIVYYPQDPYFICVMTKGANFDAMKNTIRDINEAIFSEIRNGAIQ